MIRALLIDPRQRYGRLLGQWCAELAIACNTVTGQRGLRRLILSEQPKLLFLDRTQLEQLASWRKAGLNCGTVLIQDRRAGAEGREPGADEIDGRLNLPCTLKQFRAVVSRVLARHNQELPNPRTVISLQQKVQELKTLNEIVQAINSSLEPKDILRTIMEKIAFLIRAEGWSVLLLDHDRQELVFEAAAGEAGMKLIGLRLKIGQGVAGWVAAKGESLIVPDVNKDPRFYSGVDKKTKFTTRSILCVPMKRRDTIIGVVEVVNKIGGESFTDDDLELFESLVPHITIALENANMYRRLEESNKIDDLTKLYNNRYCNQFLDELFQRPTGNRTPISLIFLDIDYFKLVDDNFGHLVGSETLKLVGSRIKKVIRDRDVAVRYGGDEYIVILPDTDKRTAGLVAERIRTAIADEPFSTFDRKKFRITVTLGVASYPQDARNRDDLIGKADKAMYEGKMTGRNKVVLT